ncbi:hypothetical protein D9C73_025104 [Collichthys lucidus]|uniref:Uncharacterized protein n=1 Tax=Collichthys lucidus TaxID=240159 RepID=A0A4U5VRV3_COLLU|nr:hypothetical protein D9C73_025104 [Collichthys lucidus]
MSGTDQNDLNDNTDCNKYGVDPIDEFVAAMAGLSISGLQRPASCAAYNRDRSETTMATLSSLPGTSTDAQMSAFRMEETALLPGKEIGNRMNGIQGFPEGGRGEQERGDVEGVRGEEGVRFHPCMWVESCQLRGLRVDTRLSNLATTCSGVTSNQTPITSSNYKFQMGPKTDPLALNVRGNGLNHPFAYRYLRLPPPQLIRPVNEEREMKCNFPRLCHISKVLQQAITNTAVAIYSACVTN